MRTDAEHRTSRAPETYYSGQPELTVSLWHLFHGNTFSQGGGS